jgi:flavin reductase (DIM6/NTAB) family NADH-FMN oxidoreductase RutF
MTAETTLDVRSDALRTLSSGVYVLTSCVGDTMHAATVTWVSQVSFEPPLVLVALQRNSRLVASLRKAHRFALNILEAGQQPVAEAFFQYVTTPVSSDTLGGYAFRGDPAHCPLLVDSLAWLECRFAADAPSPGDHSLFLGEVTGAGVRRSGSPMILWDTPWSYGGLVAP